ncbi:hypothetical protein NUW54_g8319 [Trametes sanguinea]|uniref:Uncharacterized protein n=1 Tax=Trametes sanguinea TaxID=158606 RepID=A0ACC1PHJ1_9APHY|nr:hypothetical protein NUW54_g8319 [Trametes sanguinea]
MLHPPVPCLVHLFLVLHSSLPMHRLSSCVSSLVRITELPIPKLQVPRQSPPYIHSTLSWIRLASAQQHFLSACYPIVQASHHTTTNPPAIGFWIQRQRQQVVSATTDSSLLSSFLAQHSVINHQQQVFRYDGLPTGGTKPGSTSLRRNV